LGGRWRDCEVGGNGGRTVERVKNHDIRPPWLVKKGEKPLRVSRRREHRKYGNCQQDPYLLLEKEEGKKKFWAARKWHEM